MRDDSKLAPTLRTTPAARAASTAANAVASSVPHARPSAA